MLIVVFTSDELYHLVLSEADMVATAAPMNELHCHTYPNPASFSQPHAQRNGRSNLHWLRLT